MTWEKYEPVGDDYIPIGKWGSDHWSTFAYLETLAIDRGGIVDNRKMRCNPRLHREFANLRADGGIIDGSRYPTRLKDGEQANHDDWSCLEDMVAAGLVEGEFRDRNPREVFGCMEARVKLTAKGWKVATLLRQHKASGGSFWDFELPEEERNETS